MMCVSWCVIICAMLVFPRMRKCLCIIAPGCAFDHSMQKSFLVQCNPTRMKYDCVLVLGQYCRKGCRWLVGHTRKTSLSLISLPTMNHHLQYNTISTNTAATTTIIGISISMRNNDNNYKSSSQKWIIIILLCAAGSGRMIFCQFMVYLSAKHWMPKRNSKTYSVYISFLFVEELNRVGDGVLRDWSGICLCSFV